MIIVTIFTGVFNDCNSDSLDQHGSSSLVTLLVFLLLVTLSNIQQSLVCQLVFLGSVQFRTRFFKLEKRVKNILITAVRIESDFGHHNFDFQIPSVTLIKKNKKIYPIFPCYSVSPLPHLPNSTQPAIPTPCAYHHSHTSLYPQAAKPFSHVIRDLDPSLSLSFSLCLSSLLLQNSNQREQSFI